MEKLKDVTLCYLLDQNRILLGMKKRGFGEGRWNGFGGKVNEGESVEEAVVREVSEEIGVELDKAAIEKAGIIDFFFTNAPAGKNWDQKVHVFVAKTWGGEPAESEEMRPEWFEHEKVPINEMWADDPHWLPLVIDGKKIRASFTFGQDNSSIVEKNVEVVDEL